MHIIHKISILMNYLAQKISSHFHLLKMMKFNVKYKLEMMFLMLEIIWDNKIHM
jgi:hypothetical protein